MTTTIAPSTTVIELTAQQAAQHAITAHRLIWNEIKDRIFAVRALLRDHDLLYRRDSVVPPELRWAEIGHFNGTRMSIENGRWLITVADPARGSFGQQAEIPAMFLNASTSEARRIARQILTEQRP